MCRDCFAALANNFGCKGWIYLSSCIANYWIIADIITDALTVYFIYYKEYEKGNISMAFLNSGLTFMAMPTIASVIINWIKSRDLRVGFIGT